MFFGIAILRDSGTLDAVLSLFAPLVEPLGIPREVLPLAILRPLSGSGALGCQRTDADPRCGFFHRTVGFDDPGKYGNYLLRTHRLFRLRRHSERATRRFGRIDVRPRRLFGVGIHCSPGVRRSALLTWPTDNARRAIIGRESEVKGEHGDCKNVNRNDVFCRLSATLPFSLYWPVLSSTPCGTSADQKLPLAVPLPISV